MTLVELVRNLFQKKMEAPSERKVFQKDQPPAEDLPSIQRTLDVYRERTLRLQDEILREESIVDNIVNAFEHIYLGKKRSDEVVFLGGGDTHSVLHVGKVVDPYNKRPVHLAVRLRDCQYPPYSDGSRSRLLTPQLRAFEAAFEHGENPPYFVGVVSWKHPKDESGERILGFILEDVSEREKFELTPIDHEYFLRKEENGRSTELYLDPLIGEIAPADFTSWYLRDEVRIDLN